MQIKKITIFILLLLMMIPTLIFAKDKVQVEPLFSSSSVVKGTITTYFPNIFKKHTLLTISPIVANYWAGKAYLQKKNQSENEFIMLNAKRIIEKTAEGYCSGFLGTLGYNKGYYAVDHFDFHPVADEYRVNFDVSGNIMCFTN
ncbi:hypothetical protein DEFDS_P183 (plasmid) [Deferribacter desulfuricans SSM1]|uniref:Uncharacterized protein n=1 Tax=Deferribacter desulfuricans (strain DSM 14783 / JCM 11476 / NBRC 101012 / SSM1) TaxID=639282 RepID=D3PF11_DEFDS|nr:hypothetical protein [Deferribacter desulfuricans]BAI81803.1 hypothetical protein DEFDS_P183 [Deferribacter desulfuricans SSM1]